jgi:hypothetical protein
VGVDDGASRHHGPASVGKVAQHVGVARHSRGGGVRFRCIRGAAADAANGTTARPSHDARRRAPGFRLRSEQQGQAVVVGPVLLQLQVEPEWRVVRSACWVHQSMLGATHGRLAGGHAPCTIGSMNDNYIITTHITIQCMRGSLRCTACLTPVSNGLPARFMLNDCRLRMGTCRI